MAIEITSCANDNLISNNYVWPYGWNPLPVYPYPYGTVTLATGYWDETRITALEARIAQLERENKRLRRGLGKLFIWRKGL